MTSGYSKTPLWKKLGYKSGFKALIINPPENYDSLVSPIPDDINMDNKGPYNLIHFFTNELKEMEEGLNSYKDMITKDGMIWVSWYKKASKKPSEIIEDDIRNTALALDLVDVKVCSVNNDWSGLKLVIPVKFRK